MKTRNQLVKQLIMEELYQKKKLVDPELSERIIRKLKQKIQRLTVAEWSQR